jgi:signal transduction histidine kinase/DNA-binding response OmpR family regulator/HAMP domain-containing protein
LDALADALEALTAGDFSTRYVRTQKGPLRRVAGAFNELAALLEANARELLRVSTAVGRDGQLTERAAPGRDAGGWSAQLEVVNALIDDLVRFSTDVFRIMTAVAGGDLSQKMRLDIDGAPLRGEFLRIGTTINTMVDRLRSFAAEVNRLAREVGTDGKLGGQAYVPGVAGTWKDLTDNVNQLALNLTAQVRAIAQVAQAVSEGDLTRSISVEAHGEVFALKERVNQMIAYVRETTQKNREQDWLKTNLAKFSSMMQGQKSLESVSRLIMSELTPLVGAAQGAFFMVRGDPSETEQVLRLIASYAFRETTGISAGFRFGEGLVGQCALEKKSILVNCPADYLRITSGLGEAVPVHLLVLPVLFEDEVRAVIELASFQPFGSIHRIFLDQLSENVGIVLHTIAASVRTEELLKQSQQLALELQSQSKELQAQQAELKRSNLELEAQAKSLKASEEMLKEQQEELQHVNDELEENAAQLATSSRYKSEFLANMSHELRTPLNSLLVLAKILADNKDSTLSPREVEYAKTIFSSGTALLAMINEVLDLSRVEAGKIDMYPGDVSLVEMRDYLDATFRPIAAHKNLELEIVLEPNAPAYIVTDDQRLQQILRNLLDNAFKFTERGGVVVRIGVTTKIERCEVPALSEAPFVIAFSVADTGIGIPTEKQQLIFEAFQQADGTTSRKYGGTGLGLSISRSLARLLGGELQVLSAPGEGSTFTLWLPLVAPEATPSLDADADADTSPHVRARDRSEAADAKTDAGSRSPPEPLDSALSTLVTFLDQRTANLLVVEDNEAKRAALVQLLARDERPRCVVAGIADARRLLDERRPDCVVLDLGLPARAGYDLLHRLKGALRPVEPPVVAYARYDLAQRDAARVKRYPRTIVLSGASSPERLVEGLSAFLHRVESGLPLNDLPVGVEVRRTDVVLRDTVLVIDDDVRNIFALTGLLERSGMSVVCAENGKDAIELLRRTPDIRLVLMDVMMPGMDGYETTRAIRANPSYASLPIIALTAKAMKGDRERCIEAGASDYITKPIDCDQLLSQVRVWLCG